MTSFKVVSVDIASDVRSSLLDVVILRQISFLILKAAKPTLNHDVVSPTAFSIHTLTDLYESNLTPRQKIEKCIDFLAGNAFYKIDWQISVWVREVMNPSPAFMEIFRKEGLPKISVLIKMFSEYTGYTPGDPKLYSGLITLFAPFVMCLLGRHYAARKEMPVHIPIEIMAENIKQLALANLENLKKE